MHQQEWEAWKAQEATQEFFKHIKKAKVEAQEAWANRQFTTESDNQFALGGVYAINQILDLDYEDIAGV